MALTQHILLSASNTISFLNSLPWSCTFSCSTPLGSKVKSPVIFCLHVFLHFRVMGFCLLWPYYLFLIKSYGVLDVFHLFWFHFIPPKWMVLQGWGGILQKWHIQILFLSLPCLIDHTNQGILNVKYGWLTYFPCLYVFKYYMFLASNFCSLQVFTLEFKMHAVRSLWSRMWCNLIAIFVS